MLTGEEPFRRGSQRLPATVLDFWRWAASDLITNTFRGRLAEYIVALDLGVDQSPRSAWLPWDLETGLSKPSFSIRRALAWDPKTNETLGPSRRWSDAYVFCLHHCREPSALDPLDLEQWSFFVLPTDRINAELKAAKSVGVGKVQSMAGAAIRFGEIKQRVEILLAASQAPPP